MNVNEQKQQWLTVEQIATQLQISEETVRRLLRSKKMRGIKFKGWRVSPQAFREYLEEESKGAAPQDFPGRLTPAMV